MDLTTLTKSDFKGTESEWHEIKASAMYVVTAGADETVVGDSPELYEAATAAEKGKYGPDSSAHYCDHGYQKDGKQRFPTSNASRIRAAWSYSHHKAIMAKYSAEDLKKLHSCIASRWKAVIGGEPPSLEKGK